MVRKSFICLTGMISIFLCTLGCAKKQVVKTNLNTLPAKVDTQNQTSRYTDWTNVPDVMPVYFDYDKSELLSESRNILSKNAEYLKSNQDISILIEGHTDERGTSEYNLALGEKRANAVRDYYKFLGIQLKRISTISYGKEKPIDTGHNEESWHKNRRAESKIRIINVSALNNK